jgi:hypothetical protein
MVTSKKAQLVTVKVRQLSSGLKVASSDEVPGLHTAARSMAELERKTPIVLEALMHELGRTVQVVAVESSEPGVWRWVLIPEMAEAH